MRAALSALILRQSVSPKRMVAPGPGDDEIRAIMAMALTAPDHGHLQPYRFIRIADLARERLGFVFQEIRRRAEPDAEEAVLQREREKALNGPCLLAVVGRIREDHLKVPPSEQYASVGAAVMAVLVAAHLLGYGAIMLSGDRVRDPLLGAALGMSEVEELVGFITIGTIARPPSPKQRPAQNDILSTWEGTPASDGRRG
ncbi:MAG: nitroreductase family protein [Rhodospirillales bacterium]|nr:nitroreductase family protein [Rhodospirillales bacterium]